MKRKFHISVLAIAAFLASCESNKSEDPQQVAAENNAAAPARVEKEMSAEEHLEVSDSLIKLYVANQKMDTLVTPNGIVYEYIKKNPKGKQVKFMDQVTVKYSGTLLDGTEFDHGQIDFVAGGQQVIRGWDEAVQLLREGEKIKAIIPWYQAYGDQANGPIPAYADLVFEMEVIKTISSKEQE